MKRATNHQSRARAVGGVGGRRAARAGAPRAFTIVEATIVIGIIALLAGILLLAVAHAKRRGDVLAEQAMVTTLQKAVEKFKQDFGFLPPMVVDSGPILGNTIVVWDTANLSDPAPTLNGGVRMSELSLAYYLVGALDAQYDGIDGLGFTAPDRGGQFSKHGRKIDPLVDLTQQKTRLGTPRLYIQGLGAGGPPATRTTCKILDRWSDTSNLYPIRYYRWLPKYSQPGSQNEGKIALWNIPVEIGGNIDNTLPPKKAELRTAEYAIISAGPDHIFGTADDIMEVGR